MVLVHIARVASFDTALGGVGAKPTAPLDPVGVGHLEQGCTARRLHPVSIRFSSPISAAALACRRQGRSLTFCE
jgi:hypothetical protein